MDFSLVAVSRGYSLVAVHGLFTVVASPAVEQGLPSCWTSVAVASRPESTGSERHTSLVAAGRVGPSRTSG